MAYLILRILRCMSLWTGLKLGDSGRVKGLTVQVIHWHLEGILDARLRGSLSRRNSIPCPNRIGTIWLPKPHMAIPSRLTASPFVTPSLVGLHLGCAHADHRSPY